MKKMSKNAQIAVAVVVLLVYAAGGYFLLVKPQGAKSAELQEQVLGVESQITQARLAIRAAESAPPVEKVRIADLFRLAKAMPDQTDMPGVLLELNRVARETGIVFESIAPGAAVPVAGFQAVPIDLVFEGNFYDLADFLFRTRTLVGVRDGELDARGRLFNVDKIDFSEATSLFPNIRASVRLETYVYGSAVAATPPPVAAPTAPADGAATTTPTTTPEAPAPPPEGATAMGATP